MRVISAQERPHERADSKTFTQPALFQRLLGASDGLPVRLYRVSFDVGARTHWHRHDREQLLVGTSGMCMVVSRDGTSVRLGPGDLVVIDPNEEHWHGAAPGTKGEHLAINLGSATTWLEPSSSDDS
jgi:quercetin dioxygenase-like cupin family protein